MMNLLVPLELVMGQYWSIRKKLDRIWLVLFDSGEFDYCTSLFNIDLALNEVFRFNVLIPSQKIVLKKSDTGSVHLDGILCLSLNSPVLDGMLSVLISF
jgi:hypothetical protein